MQTRGITPYPAAIGIASCRWLRLCRSRLASTIHRYPHFAGDVMCCGAGTPSTDKGMTMQRKPFDQMTDDEQNALIDQWIAEAKANPVQVVMPAETAREGYYHAKPDPIA